MEESTVTDYTAQLESIQNQLSSLDISVPDYSAELMQISGQLDVMQQSMNQANTYIGYASGFLLFLVVCVLLKGIYKFFKIFF